MKKTKRILIALLAVLAAWGFFAIAWFKPEWIGITMTICFFAILSIAIFLTVYNMFNNKEEKK